MYEDRLVVFLDILGFKSEIKKSRKDKNKFTKIYNFLTKYSGKSHAAEVFKGMHSYEKNLTEDEILNNLRKDYPYSFTQCSDSFVFSTKTCDTHSCNYMLLIIGQFIEDAFRMGFLIRGGLARGYMIHEENGPMFGPAFNKAYDLESNKALY